MTRRRGPRSDNVDTREAILESARTAFAAVGYERATIRRIASDAAVDPALVHHYFGTKEALFAAAVQLPIAPEQMVDEVFAAGIDQAAPRLATLFFRIWEAPETRTALVGQVRMALATGEPPILRDFLTTALFRRVAERLDGRDRDLRVQLAASHLLGLAMARYVIRLEPLASTPVEQIVAAVSPQLERYLAGE